MRNCINPVNFLCLLFVVAMCSSNNAGAQNEQYLFEKVGSGQTGVHFVNRITDSIVSAAGKYIYISNSSGTGVADLNGDGKPDLFFSSNTGENKLYLNEGNFKFKDVTYAAGMKGNGKWGTGVCIADINGDGLLDIFISHSGNYPDRESLCNEAYICTGIDANGIPHYVDKAKELGLDLPGSQTTQVVFFDYDRDGDLDCFVLNHSKNQNGDRFIRNNFMPDTSTRFIGYNLLLRNDVVNGRQHYTDVTEKAGITNSKFNFGLGVVISDLNNDNWPDIYCTSDFAERDRIYINNHDGTFTETGLQSLRHGAKNSMGTDAADFNNDLLPDIMNVDMLADDNYHLKLQLHPDNTDQHEIMVNMGLSNQYPKNMLQLNIGSDNGVPIFAEIAQMSGVSNTNWSWTPLFIDVNNDGWKDLFISNGFYKDYTNQDVQNKYITNKKENSEYGEKRLNSCMFINNKSLQFTNVEPWKVEDPMMSYSACAADLDNDGSLDLIINNLNDEVTILKNIIPKQGNYINIKLKENDKNTFALGAKVYVTCNNLTQMQEMQNVRGYQSSQDYMLHFGLGNTDESVQIRIIWPDGTESETTANAHTTTTITKDAGAHPLTKYMPLSKWRFEKNDHFCADSVGHVENKFNDFKGQFTLPYRQSRNGPAVAEGDINGDGIKDYYIGGSTGGERYFLLGQKDGTYKKYIPVIFALESVYEDAAAALFDIDGDGDLDLVVVNGGVEHPENPNFFTDRVFRNDGRGNFERMQNVFPNTNVSKSCLAVGDYDGDGKLDLFIGGYTIPGKFEQTPISFIFKNESDPQNIKFADVTSTVLSQAANLGMVTSASWVKSGDEKYPDLLVGGEWMACKLFRNQRGILQEELNSGMDKLRGLYSLVYPTDYNGDGRVDFIVGNAGNNSQYKASMEKPMKIFAIKDTVNRVRPGFLFSYYCKDVEAFASPRNEMLQEFVPYRKYFPDFATYAGVDVKGFFKTVNTPEPDPVMTCTNLLSGVYLNKGDGSFKFEALPELLQTSRINTIAEVDWNFDGKKDYVIAGNFFGYKHQFGPSDAFPAYILQNDGNGRYHLVMPDESGLFVEGQVKKICVTQTENKCQLLFVRNNDKIVVYENSKN